MRICTMTAFSHEIFLTSLGGYPRAAALWSTTREYSSPQPFATARGRTRCKSVQFNTVYDGPMSG